VLQPAVSLSAYDERVRRTWLLVAPALVAAGCGSSKQPPATFAVPTVTAPPTSTQPFSAPTRRRLVARIIAATHTPKADNKTHWEYRVRLTDPKGKPLAGSVTIAIVDPLGTAHPVQFGANTKYVANWPFKGVFKDWVRWPPDSAVGVVLKFRATVTTARGKAVLIYPVKPHA
jgi:hypothetical protein